MFVAECKAMVKQYLPELIRLLETETDRGACRRIGMCAAAAGGAHGRKLLASQCAPSLHLPLCSQAPCAASQSAHQPCNHQKCPVVTISFS